MADFTYDGRSFLRQAEEPLGGGDQATSDPTYSSEGLLHCLERQQNAAATPETVDYFYFAGRPVAQRHSDGATDTWTFLTTDHLGTPAIATNLAGEETWLGPFEPFGRDYLAETIDPDGKKNGALDNGLFLRLPGQWDDGRWAGASSGADLYYNVHRWYEYGTGRYGRPDPLGVLGDPHPYLYATSRPTVVIDPLGLLAQIACVRCKGTAGPMSCRAIQVTPGYPPPKSIGSVFLTNQGRNDPSKLGGIRLAPSAHSRQAYTTCPTPGLRSSSDDYQVRPIMVSQVNS